MPKLPGARALRHSERVVYTCEECGGTFDSDWSDEEAQAESKRLWGNVPDEHMAIVCEVCFEKLLRKIAE